MPERRLVDLISEAREDLLEDSWGSAINEMVDILTRLGIKLDTDLTCDEFVETLYHVDAYLEGEIDSLSNVAEHLETESSHEHALFEGQIKAGFKMVFGKLVKLGKQAYHKGAGALNNYHAKHAGQAAAKYKAKARMHAAKALGNRSRPARKAKSRVAGNKGIRSKKGASRPGSRVNPAPSTRPKPTSTKKIAKRKPGSRKVK